ncbi:hypothetical protein [Tissierella sp. Yu-01]|uniref:hypothetical protein n=1 Tax=Tissierella sp. Yu-01 TaxID=3035694 RepID=UPI00240CE68A|nr:hypothetical protein [Tissierella sp. Yu-01]WFA07840.1 hypothetical protein P3962_08855 [Tissierella sp. Yu-01]
MNPLAMIDMKSKLKGHTENYKSNSKFNNNNFISNNGKLEDREVSLLKDIIQGDKKPVVENSSARVMSLDEAVNYIKRGR